jgi:hypothetical protein
MPLTKTRICPRGCSLPKRCTDFKSSKKSLDFSWIFLIFAENNFCFFWGGFFFIFRIFADLNPQKKSLDSFHSFWIFQIFADFPDFFLFSGSFWIFFWVYEDYINKEIFKH